MVTTFAACAFFPSRRRVWTARWWALCSFFLDRSAQRLNMLEVLCPVMFMQASAELPDFHDSCAALRRKSWKILPTYFGFSLHDFPHAEHFLLGSSLKV